MLNTGFLVSFSPNATLYSARLISNSILVASQLVTCGSVVGNAHEVQPEFLSSVQVFCDYKATTPEQAGEMVLAAQNTRWTTEQLIGDLPDLLCGNYPLSSDYAPIFFRSLGLGLEDIAVAHAIYLAHQENQNK